MPLIETDHLKRLYQLGGETVAALDGVSISVDEGDFVAVMGPSGSGKSTFMNVIGCLDKPTAGTYRLDGELVSKLSRDELAAVRNRKIGFVFQQFHLLDRLEALANVELPMVYAAQDRNARREKAIAALKRVGLGERIHHRPTQLSGGQQQRVAIARALVNNPKMLLADEPTGALDSRTSVELMALFQELNREGMTVVIVTHESDVAAYANRLIRFRDGHVRVGQPPDTGRCGERIRGAEPDTGRASRGRGMTNRDAIMSALDALRLHKLRSALTMLGIIIGVGAVIAMMAVGGGAREQVVAQIRSLGANLLFITPGNITQGGVRLGSGAASTLTEDDAIAIGKEVAGVQAVAPYMRGTAQLIVSGQNWATSVFGVDNGFFEAREWDAELGRLFEPEEIARGAQVAVIGQSVARNLYGGLDPVGQELRIRNVPFRVIGVLTKKGQSTWGQDQDDVVMTPLVTARQRVLGRNQANARAVGFIYVKVADGQDMTPVEDDVKRLLRQRHRLQAGQDDDFTVRNLADIAATREASARTLALLARGGRRRLARGRRHRHHEHHAGVGDRAHPRDRIAARGRRAAMGYPAAVPVRGDRPCRDRRLHRRAARGRRGLPDFERGRLAAADRADVDRARGAVLRTRRRILRLVSGASRLQARSDRGAAAYLTAALAGP